MRKQILAAIAAILITGTIAMSMFVVGTNALANQNGTAASNSPATAAAVSSAGAVSSGSTQAQIGQLQAQLAQYQAREQQYQAALNSDNTQLAQATSEIQMVQQLLAYLQQRGLIQIDSNGQIFVTGGR